MTTTLVPGSIEDRLDVLATQVAFMADELAAQRKARLNATELMHELSPISGQAMDMATRLLGDLDSKGYLEFGTQLLAVVDRVVTSFTPEDVKALGDNVVLILEAVKEMTQPEVMTMLRRTAVSAQQIEGEVTTAPSTMGLIKELRDPEVRLGLARTLSVLRTIGAEEEVKSKKE